MSTMPLSRPVQIPSAAAPAAARRRRRAAPSSEHTGPSWRRLAVATLAASGLARAQGTVEADKRVAIDRFVATAGSATAADLDRVAAHLGRLPLPLLQEAVARRPALQLAACKNNVTDADPSLLTRLTLNTTGLADAPPLTALDVTSYYSESARTAVVSASASNGTDLIHLDDPEFGSPVLVTFGMFVSHALAGFDRYGRLGTSLARSADFTAALRADAAALNASLPQNATFSREVLFGQLFAQSFNVPESRRDTPNVWAYFSELLCAYGDAPSAEPSASTSACTRTLAPTSTPVGCATLTALTVRSTLTMRTVAGACDATATGPTSTIITTRPGPTSVITSIAGGPTGGSSPAAGPTPGPSSPSQASSDAVRRAQPAFVFSWPARLLGRGLWA